MTPPTLKKDVWLICAITLMTNLHAQQPPLDPNLPEDFINVTELQEEIYRINDAIRHHPFCFQKHGSYLETIANKLKEVSLSQADVTILINALKRYKALATVCHHAAPGDELVPDSALYRMLALFDARETIIRQVVDTIKPCLLANIALANLAAHLGRAPTPREVERYTKERDELVNKATNQIAELNEKLFSIERDIFKDRRSWFTKYGSTLLGGIATGLSIWMLFYACNKMHAYFSK